jgi:hypothetical protein
MYLSQVLTACHVARELGMCSRKASLILEAGEEGKGMRWRTPDEHTSMAYKASMREYERLFRQYDLCVPGAHSCMASCYTYMYVCMYVCMHYIAHMGYTTSVRVCERIYREYDSSVKSRHFLDIIRVCSVYLLDLIVWALLSTVQVCVYTYIHTYTYRSWCRDAHAASLCMYVCMHACM